MSDVQEVRDLVEVRETHSRPSVFFRTILATSWMEELKSKDTFIKILKGEHGFRFRYELWVIQKGKDS